MFEVLDFICEKEVGVVAFFKPSQRGLSILRRIAARRSSVTYTLLQVINIATSSISASPKVLLVAMRSASILIAAAIAMCPHYRMKLKARVAHNNIEK
jgi:hypothetical protein